MICESSKRAVTELCSGLVRAQSLSGEEHDAVSHLRDAMESIGFDSVEIDRYGSLVACIAGSRPGPSIVLDAHIDTVPVQNEAEWSHPPFAGEIAQGKLYGRGTSDMKGSLAAMTIAAADFALACNGDFAGRIYIAAVVCEELFEGVAARSVCELTQPDYVIIGEASEQNLKIGQRGRAEVVVETTGVPAHSANPQKGVNAVTSMRKLLDEIDGIAPPHSVTLGDGILVLTDLISKPYPGSSVLPKLCIATFDRRLLPGETETDVLAPLQACIDKLTAKDASFHATTYIRTDSIACYTGEHITAKRFFPGWEESHDTDYVTAVLDALRAVNRNTALSTYSFCTNGSYYAGEAGIRTLGYGPSHESLAHTTDEYIALDELYTAVEGYQAILRTLTAL